jgi:hypothetical protein
MTCETCNKEFSNSICVACGENFVSCGCTTNICLACRKTIYSDPAKHRFGIAWLTLLDCSTHMFDKDLMEKEVMAKELLLQLIGEIALG